jgi:WD40 repeat protein
LKNLSEKPEILCVFHSCDKHGVVWSVAFSRDGKRLASTGDNGTIRLWDRKGIEWKENIKFLPKQNDKDVTSVTSVNFSPNGQKLATAGTDGNVHVWDLQDKESARALIEIPTNQNKIWEVSFSSDGQELASAGEDGSVRLWDYSQKLELEKLEGHHGPVRSVSFRRNDQELASAGDDGSARLWKLQGNASEKFAVPIKKATTGQQKVEIQNGNQRAFGNKDGTVTWKGKMKSSHVGAVKSLAFNPDGTQLASGGKDRTIRLWNANGEQQQILQTYAPVNSLAYSSDKHWLASAGEDSSVQLWNLKDLQEGKPYAAWKAYQGAVKNISFSQDGKVLITSGKDRTAKLRKIEWQIESFDELMTRGCNRVRDYLKNNPNVSDRDLCDTVQSLEAAKQVPPVEQLLTEPFVNPSPQITQTQTVEVPVKERPEKTQPSVGTKAPKVNKKSGAPSQKETPPLSSPAKAPLKDKSKLKSTKLRANRLPSQRMGAKPTSGTPSNVMIDSSQEVPLKRKEPAAAPAVTSSVDCYSAQAKQTYQCRNRKN